MKLASRVRLLVLLLGCGDARAERQVPRADAGLDAEVERDAAPGEDQPGASPEPDAGEDDPTAPGPNSGVRLPPGPAYEAQLAQLLAYKRPALSGSCPGLFIAGSCGDGTCNGPDETPANCAADCQFHLVGAYNDLPICPSYLEIVAPKSTDELIAAVQRAVQQGKRLRAIGRRHSASNAICGDGVALDMAGFADPAAVRREGDVVYAPAGMLLSTLGDLLRERYGVGLGFAHLGFRDVSIAGAVGTSAHGSSPLHNTALSHRVRAITLVGYDGQLHTYRAEETPEDTFRALTTHLGLFGVITELGLSVEPARALDTEVGLVEESVVLDEAGPLAGVAGCDFAQYNWFPKHRKALRWCGKLSDAPVQLADNVLLDPGVSADLSGLAKSGFHAGTCDSGLNALLEEVRMNGLRDRPPIRVTEGSGTRFVNRAVGPVHRMTSANLIELGGQKYFQMDWEVAIPAQYAADALRAARQVFDAHDVSLPGVGVFIRFGKVERGSWLSYHSAGKQFAEGDAAMFFETPVAVPAGYGATELRDYLHVYQELISLFVRHFGARAHWGKNLDAVFELQRELGTYAGRIEKLNQVVAELDPYGVFANDFARKIGVRWPREGEQPTQSCDCPRVSEPVCNVPTMQTHASACQADCAGVSTASRVARPCAALVVDSCSLFDARRCVWERVARQRDAATPPLLRL